MYKSVLQKSNEELFEAVNTISDYCRKTDCDNCLFSGIANEGHYCHLDCQPHGWLIVQQTSKLKGEK